MNNERKYMWAWVNMAPMKEDQVCSLTMIAMKELGEVGQYNKREVWLLNWILNHTVPPIWLGWEWRKDGTNTQEDNREMADQYNKLIMDEFKELNILK